ncbi:MAG: glycoside hydrolase family 65 protein [Culturomica sp.]|jgi:maltose phosphorylase|nr:glycoside hydrolase family 65 protein [Culturomica sp.]
MNKYTKTDEWCIIEEGFKPQNQCSSESIFSIGNGRMGQRANFEEHYSGETLLGTYIGGVYYNDKTRVGWWKNGYPEYFAKVLNAPNWTGINININGEVLDLAVCRTENFVRILNMKEGLLERSFTAETPNGKRVKVSCKRFISMADKEAALISYSVKPLNFSGEITFTPYIDGDVFNKDANYDEQFWESYQSEADNGSATLYAVTKKTAFHVCLGMKYSFETKSTIKKTEIISKTKFVGNVITIDAIEGEEIRMIKYVAVLSSLNHEPNNLQNDTQNALARITAQTFEAHFEAHKKIWAEIWKHSDIVINGDVEAQQGIRFNIFQLNQTYTGDDNRLNIGPKGFTGEKYGGGTYWDTEAYCVPFYLATASAEVGRNLLLYRYKQLDKAIENAEKLGFSGGAALYPMVTMDGTESHNEWEITFEEIHRNGAIAYAIHNYVNYTGDEEYITTYGLPVLIGISRFWAQRCTWSEEREMYVMLGITGPNEYENNVNNNWYTNKIAKWCMEYTMFCVEKYAEDKSEALKAIFSKYNFDREKEVTQWRKICENMYLPENKTKGIFLQQDNYLDKEQILAADLPSEIRPLNQHWSWDRILRSCFIKQADVLQGIFFFEEEYDLDTICRNFDFYEARTVHESSLSPCVHSILASKLGKSEKAYELYLRTARLDLDDYNNEAHEGLHITSMAGTWMSVVMGFGGLRVRNGVLCLEPVIPAAWQSYTFNVFFRDHNLKVQVSKNKCSILNNSEKPLNICFKNNIIQIQANQNKEL